MRALEDFYQRQASSLRVFMTFRHETLRRVVIDEDRQRILLKMLSGMEDEPDFPHSIAVLQVPYTSSFEFFQGLLGEVQAIYANWKSDLADLGIEPDLPSVPGWPDQRRALTGEVPHPGQVFVRYVSALSDSMPDSVGSLVFVLLPPHVGEVQGFRQSMAYLARATTSEWVKYIVPDDRTSPRLEGLEDEVDRVHAQTFHIEPEEIESGLRRELDEPTAPQSSTERERTLSLLAGFAFARRDYDEAKSLQLEQLRLMDERDPQPVEAAIALYGLGNTCLARGELLEAEACLSRAVDLAGGGPGGRLMPLALTQLGSCLHQQRRSGEGENAFELARRAAGSLGDPPTEAHVLDRWAETLEVSGRLEGARTRWQQALEVYDGISSETFGHLRESGSSHIRERLERLAQRMIR